MTITRFKRIRKGLGLSQEDLAEIVGRNQGRPAMIEGIDWSRY